MAKPEWGTKRTCSGCGIRFYDMKKRSVTCPACETALTAEVATRTRKSAPAAAKVVPVADEAAKIETSDAGDTAPDTRAEDVEIEIEDDGDGDDDSLIEDASDLSEGDDMPEIAERMEVDEDTDS